MITLRNRSLTFLLLWLSTIANAPAFAQGRDVPMIADRWEPVFGKPEFNELARK